MTHGQANFIIILLTVNMLILIVMYFDKKEQDWNKGGKQMSNEPSKRFAELQEEYKRERAKFNAIRNRIMTDMLAIAPTKEEDKFKWDK